MMQSLIEVVVENGFQAVGWAVLKVATLGRYRGFQSKDTLREGTLGLGAVVVVGFPAWPGTSG